MDVLQKLEMNYRTAAASGNLTAVRESAERLRNAYVMEREGFKAVEAAQLAARAKPPPCNWDGFMVSPEEMLRRYHYLTTPTA
jgi:hypothetical protein